MTEESRGSQAAPRILLIGMMGAGKTTVGSAIANQTGWPYLDNDALVEEATGRSTHDVLAEADEPLLRRVELAALEVALAAAPPLVAGVAAGTVTDPGARQRMREGGFVVYLRAPLNVLTGRLGEGEGRPWLDAEPAAALTALYAGREALYREVADLVLDVEGVPPEDLATHILTAATT